MEIKEKLWNIFFLILFIIISILIFPNLPIEEIKNIQILELILITLATQRLIRLFVYDKIMTFLRDFFHKNKNSLCDCINSLLGCPWCFGIWATLIILSIYYLCLFGKIIILLLAISTLAASFQILMNFVGWSAEYKKQKTNNIKKESQNNDIN
jgi:hypothetical protein